MWCAVCLWFVTSFCVEEFVEEATNLNKNRKAQIYKVFKLMLPLVNRAVDSPQTDFYLQILRSR